MTKNIVPIQVFDTQAVKVTVDDIKVNLGVSADCQFQVLASDGSQLRVGRVTIDGDDYNNWGSDDEYLFAKVLSKLPVPVTVSTG